MALPSPAWLCWGNTCPPQQSGTSDQICRVLLISSPAGVWTSLSQTCQNRLALSWGQTLRGFLQVVPSWRTCHHQCGTASYKWYVCWWFVWVCAYTCNECVGYYVCMQKHRRIACNTESHHLINSSVCTVRYTTIMYTNIERCYCAHWYRVQRLQWSSIWVHDCIFKMELYWLHCSGVARIAGFIN